MCPSESENTLGHLQKGEIINVDVIWQAILKAIKEPKLILLRAENKYENMRRNPSQQGRHRIKWKKEKNHENIEKGALSKLTVLEKKTKLVGS